MLGHVAVQADEGGERGRQRPVEERLRHRRAAAVVRLGRVDGLARLGGHRQEVAVEAVQRRGAAVRHGLAVMVARDGHERQRIVFVRRVELRVVLGNLPVIVDDVAQMQAKRRAHRRTAQRRLQRTLLQRHLHAPLHQLLRLRVLHAARIAHAMECHAAGGGDLLHLGGREDAVQRHAIRRLPPLGIGLRNRLKGSVAGRRLVREGRAGLAGTAVIAHADAPKDVAAAIRMARRQGGV